MARRVAWGFTVRSESVLALEGGELEDAHRRM